MKAVYKLRYNTFIQSLVVFGIVCKIPFDYNLKIDDSGWVILSILISAIQVYRQYKLTKTYNRTFMEVKKYIHLDKEQKESFKFSNPNFNVNEFIEKSPKTMKYLFGDK